jgi:hypothetical protein
MRRKLSKIAHRITGRLQEQSGQIPRIRWY